MPASFFFFSSRRRHTRFDCDWSSDVCSSDLFTIPTPALLAKVVDMIDRIPMEDRDTKGDLYEYFQEQSYYCGHSSDNVGGAANAGTSRLFCPSGIRGLHSLLPIRRSGEIADALLL